MSEYPVEISVVVPVYNSERTLNELCERLKFVLERQLKKSFEIIFVDDHSADNSWAILEELRRIDPRVKIIRLIRNFGQHNATICGFYHCSGEYIITIDDDLQHPPEEIPKLLSKIEDGNDVVLGVFSEKKHSMFRNLGSGFINYLQNRILGNPESLRFTGFRILKHDVVEKITAKAQSQYCYLTAYILKYVAPDKIANIQVVHHLRKIGRSNYTIFKMLALASNLLINYSAIPLRFMIYSGFAISAGCIIYALQLLLRVVFEGPIKIAGWASLAILTTFLFGTMFLFLGILGEYIFRILRELSGNEPYIIKETHGFDMPEQKNAGYK